MSDTYIDILITKPHFGAERGAGSVQKLANVTQKTLTQGREWMGVSTGRKKHIPNKKRTPSHAQTHTHNAHGVAGRHTGEGTEGGHTRAHPSMDTVHPPTHYRLEKNRPLTLPLPAATGN